MQGRGKDDAENTLGFRAQHGFFIRCGVIHGRGQQKRCGLTPESIPHSVEWIAWLAHLRSALISSSVSIADVFC